MVQRAALLPYLNPFDQFVQRELRAAYLRYVDDFLLYSDDKRQLWAWKRAVRDHLAGLRLTLHEARSTVYPVASGIPFLGFRIYPHRRRLKRANGVAFARRFRRHCAAVADGELTYEDLHRRVQGWIAHAAHGETEGLRRSLFLAQPIPRYQQPGLPQAVRMEQGRAIQED